MASSFTRFSRKFKAFGRELTRGLKTTGGRIFIASILLGGGTLSVYLTGEPGLAVEYRQNAE